MYYLIKTTLEPCDIEAVKARKTPFIAVISSEEWKVNRDSFHMEMDRETAAQIGQTGPLGAMGY